MKKLSLLSQTVAITLLAIPFGSQANSWSCRHDNNVREIHITSESETSSVPCSVVYKKLTEGVEDQILWTAQNDASYCEEKAKAFVEKQIGWGWTCVETISDNPKAGAEAPEAPAETKAAEETPETAPAATGSSITTP